MLFRSGHTIFWAAGGYAAAMLAVNAGWNGWATAAAAIVVSVVLATVLGLITLRTREFVFSLVTYAAAVVAMEIAFNWSFLGGSDGIVGVPPLALPFFGKSFGGAGNAELWTIAWLLLMGTLLFTHRFRRSRLGTAALMVQMNPDLATALGVAFFAIGQLLGLGFWANVLFAIGIIVANVPEGLLPTVTLALAMATQRMARRQAQIGRAHV